MDPNPDLFLCVLLSYGPCVGAHACRVPDTARSLSFTIFCIIPLHFTNALLTPDPNPHASCVSCQAAARVWEHTRAEVQIPQGIYFTQFV